MTRPELQRILSEPNTLVDISVGDVTVHRSSHGLFLVVDCNNQLHFIDPNSPYEIPALSNDAKSLDKVINIIYSYFNRVDNLTSYQYTNELKAVNKIKL